MFKQRLITALLLAPLALLAIYYSNLFILVGVVMLLVVTSGFEWLQLIPVTHVGAKLGFLVCLLLATALIHLVFDYWLGLGLCLWLFISIALCSFPKSQAIWGYPAIVMMFALILLPLFSQSFITIYQQNQGKALIVYLILLVWGADVGGYIVGKTWGKHHFIPLVSPGKTVEGLLGGAILTLLVAIAGYVYFDQLTDGTLGHQPTYWLSFAMFVFIMALVGDLFISMLKRRVKLKDTGNLFPGHGGMLDRMDSFIAATPAFCFALYLTPV